LEEIKQDKSRIIIISDPQGSDRGKGDFAQYSACECLYQEQRRGGGFTWTWRGTIGWTRYTEKR